MSRLKPETQYIITLTRHTAALYGLSDSDSQNHVKLILSLRKRMTKLTFPKKCLILQTQKEVPYFISQHSSTRPNYQPTEVATLSTVRMLTPTARYLNGNYGSRSNEETMTRCLPKYMKASS
jgi:hypothetical protein